MVSIVSDISITIYKVVSYELLNTLMDDFVNLNDLVIHVLFTIIVVIIKGIKLNLQVV